jgi:hypothetical protein
MHPDVIEELARLDRFYTPNFRARAVTRALAQRVSDGAVGAACSTLAKGGLPYRKDIVREALSAALEHMAEEGVILSDEQIEEMEER